ncbi:phosphate-selective porin O and P [Methylophaga lonarensis MPL]|uniref:Phosphate-selective porin O and P n=1 Tax=Methylophaga lonarensis MPL TaxID=1286106 RepID=M7PIL4_9GAMM|nr:porin [Methylophaga lonarensis]EMR13730.1 phosphate-selective porin O and P [Methylophaga lonarensis MPL]
MRQSKFIPILLATSLLALTPVTQASELELLINMLHENGMVSDEQYGRLIAELNQNKQATETEKQQELEARQVMEARLDEATKPPEVEVTTRGGIRVRTTDGEFETRLRGRLMVDAAAHNGNPDLGDGTEIRRARLAWTGRIFHDWSFQLDYDFADGGKLRDSFVSYEGFEDIRLRTGLMEIPFQLQYRTSSSNSQLIERSLLGAFGGDRYIGVMGDIKKQHWSFAAGAFGDTATRKNPINDEGWGLGSRLTVAPINSDGRLLHFGTAVMYRNVDKDASGQQRVVRFSEQPEARVAGRPIVDTGDISNSRSFTRYGAETAVIRGPFSAQAEYVYTAVSRSSASNLGFDGWHLQAGYFLTNDARVYERGEFGAVTPKHQVGQGGIGAWELTLRYSSLDLSDRDIIGGEMDLFNVGVNWFPVPMLRFSANYIDVIKVKDGPNDGQKPRVFLVRSQWAF